MDQLDDGFDFEEGVRFRDRKRLTGATSRGNTPAANTGRGIAAGSADGSDAANEHGRPSVLKRRINQSTTLARSHSSILFPLFSRAWGGSFTGDRHEACAQQVDLVDRNGARHRGVAAVVDAVTNPGRLTFAHHGFGASSLRPPTYLPGRVPHRSGVYRERFGTLARRNGHQIARPCQTERSLLRQRGREKCARKSSTRGTLRMRNRSCERCPAMGNRAR